MNRYASILPAFFLVFVLLVSACGNVELDNPSETSVSVKVGGENYDLAPGGRQTIKLDPGDHPITIKTVTGEMLADTTIRVREGGVINAGKGNYVIWRDLYGLQANRATLLNEEWVELDSVEYFGDFKLIDSTHVYVESTWHFGLAQTFPSSQKLMIFKDFVIDSKIFRQTEFVKEYNRRAGTSG